MIVPFPKKKRSCVAEIHPVAKSEFRLYLPVFASAVPAGVPSLVEDYTEGHLDLNEHLISNPQKTFIVKVSGDSMLDAGIHPDDLLIVDQSIDPQDGHVVVAALDGDLTVKRLCRQGERVFLMPENSGYAGIEVGETAHFVIWGVVTNVIHRLG